MKKSSHIRLSVNLNKVALLRNARHTGIPNLIDFVDLSLEAGAHGITLHPRQDERHIRKSDVIEIAKRMRPLRPQKELNIEGTPDERLVRIIDAIKPEQCTLVPDTVSAFTSEKGWDLTPDQMRTLKAVIPKLHATKTRVILFVDPGFSAFEKIRALKAGGIEIYTGTYAELFKTGRHSTELKKITATARTAHAFGLEVHIGHDLNLKNLPPLLTEARAYISEASIGHELTADALKMGFPMAVRAYRATLASAATSPEKKPAEKNPFAQFKIWHSETRDEQLPNAMVLATSTKAGAPSARIVFLREYDAKGLTFFTNYKSRKSRELAENPRAAVVFYWNNAGRQVRIIGRVSKTSNKVSAAYFATRPRESQLSAWASEQSAVLADPEVLEQTMQKMRRKFEGKKIPTPPHWGGFRLIPDEFEFWEQGAAGRLHTRSTYKKNGTSWKQRRIAP